MECAEMQLIDKCFQDNIEFNKIYRVVIQPKRFFQI